LGNTALAHLLAAAQMPLYWVALIITIISGGVYFAKNASVVSATLEDQAPAPAPGAEPAAVASEAKPAIAEIAPKPAPVQTPAFKEWEAVVEALGHGAQIIILRKGGISEGRAGFQARHPRFWLFPTAYHQQWEKTKPELQRYLAPAAATAGGKEITLQYFADVTDAVYLETWEQVERLRDTHFWNDEILRERFDYAGRPGLEPGLHLLIVRVSRINLPHRLAASAAYDGCKSWIDVPVDWEHDIPTHVVRNDEFTTRRSRILAAVSTVSVSSSTVHLPKVKLTPRTA
jgi:hypothetical protein